SAQIASTGVSYPMPALHILGMAVRDTTTATPAATGTAVALATGVWTGAFASPIETSFSPTFALWGNQTFRVALPMAAGAPAGAGVRIRLSDPAFQASPPGPPVVIGAATLARQPAARRP